MPFQLRNGFLIVVEGRIGNLTGLKFILDTGVTHSIVHQKIADGLGLQLQPAKIFNFDRTRGIKSAAFPDVQFGPVRAAHASMLVGDLGELSDFARDIDAVIGLDFLQLSNVTLDYEAKKVVFQSYDRSAPGSLAKSAWSCLTVEMQVQHHPVRLIVDTGFEGILFYEERLLKRIPELRIPSKVKEGSIRAEMRVKRVSLPGVRLGPTVRDHEVFLMKSPPDDVMAGIDGILGLGPLKARRVYLNFETNTLKWE
jgi:predicted aspartyl protease